MSKIEEYTTIAETSFGGIQTANDIVTAMYQKHIQKYSIADKYLQDIILEKGKPTKEDLEVAARLYAIPQMRKEYKNIANILIKSDQLFEKWKPDDIEKPEEINEDWLNYFLDRARLVSDEDIQKLWACILTQECFKEGAFRKVMLDRLALLDRKSAALFQILCNLTYKLEVSDGRTYFIPLYLRNDTLHKMVEDERICFTEKDAILYQEEFCIEGKSLSAEELEEELEILDEIGLITLSTEVDVSDTYSLEEVEFKVDVDGEDFEVSTIYDENQNVYYVETGSAHYTKMGKELYKALSKTVRRQSYYLRLLQAYMDYQVIEE